MPYEHLRLITKLDKFFPKMGWEAIYNQEGVSGLIARVNSLGVAKLPYEVMSAIEESGM